MKRETHNVLQAQSVLYTACLGAAEGQPFFYMAFACCVNVYMVNVNVHTSST